MKTRFYFPMILSLLVISVSLLTACGDSDNPLSDTTKPVIDLKSPAEGGVLAIGSEHGVHFEMDLSDDVMLKSYKIEIHNNFDHHSHDTRTAETTVDFTFNKSYDVSEQRTAHIHHHPEAFQRLSVRSSRQCYLSFNLAKGRSLGFASTPSDYPPY